SAAPKGRAKEVMDRQSDRLPRQTRCEGMRIKREIQMGASGGGQSIKASGIAARTGRTQTCNRHDSPKPKTPLTRGGRPHNLPPAASQANPGSAPFFFTEGATREPPARDAGVGCRGGPSVQQEGSGRPTSQTSVDAAAVSCRNASGGS